MHIFCHFLLMCSKCNLNKCVEIEVAQESGMPAFSRILHEMISINDFKAFSLLRELQSSTNLFLNVVKWTKPSIFQPSLKLLWMDGPFASLVLLISNPSFILNELQFLCQKKKSWNMGRKQNHPIFAQI